MADEYLWKTSNESQMDSHNFIDKEVLYVSDSNGGSYSGQITLETSVLANSGKFLAYNEAYLEIPFVVSMQSNVSLTTATSACNGFLLGLKNGYHQIIDSIQLDFGNANVQQLQPYTNFYVSYKLNTELSQLDVQKYGDIIGFDLDNGTSSQYNAAASSQGSGTCNNVVFPSYLGVGVDPAQIPYRTVLDSGNVNQGFLNRMKNNAMDFQVSVDTIAASTGWNSNPGMSTSAPAAAVAKNYFTSNGVSGTGYICQWVMVCTIRMKDISDFMANLPLLRGGYLRMIINYNSCLTTVGLTTSGVKMDMTSYTQLSGRTNPLLMASAASNNPMNLLTALTSDKIVTVGCGVKSTASPASTVNPPITSCRLYVPAYQLNPVQESYYLTAQPTKVVRYDDIYNYNITNIAGNNGGFNSILTNGLVNVKKVVCIPFLTTSGIANAGASSVKTYQSIFDTCPATTSPVLPITNFQVQVSGQNMFQVSEQYDFQQFLDELSQTGLNGGQGLALQSGLISYKNFVHNYRYYVCDVSRRVPAEDRVPKSVVISGTNVSNAAIDLICFIVFERAVTIDMRTGQPIASEL